MGEFQLRLTSQAARDLQEIVAYIARDNPAAAERFGFALVEKAELLKKFPLLGKKCSVIPSTTSEVATFVS
jgi:plasmid stabilization system protein ParE